MLAALMLRTNLKGEPGMRTRLSLGSQLLNTPRVSFILVTELIIVEQGVPIVEGKGRY